MTRFAFMVLALMASMFFIFGCGSDEPTSPVASGDEPPVAAQEPGDSPDEPEPAAPDEDGDENGEEPEPGDDGPIPFDRLWPNHPLAKELLIDPEDTSQVFSYWRDAKVGDWVRFLTHSQKLAIFQVTEREGKKIKMEAKHFELDGKEIPKEKPDIRPVDIDQDDGIMRGTLVGIPFLVRTIYDWEMFNSTDVLHCERRTVDNPTGENNETCFSWKVRCGGYVFQRRGNNTYVLMVDYGDADNPPKWDHLKPADLLKYWYSFNRFLDQPILSQEDSPDGEMPEKPEDAAPQELAGRLGEADKIIGKAFAKILKAKRFDDAGASLTTIKETVGSVREYAEANNYLPALEETEKVVAKADELQLAMGGGDDAAIAKLYKELLSLIDRLYVSVHYVKEKKR